MRRTTPPAFLLFVDTWRGSRKVSAMSFSARGLFVELLIEQWRSGSIPASPAECANVIGGTAREWSRAWPKLRGCFEPQSDGRLVNPMLEGLRRDRDRFVEAQRESGRKGAVSRWRPDGDPTASGGDPMGSGSDPLGSDGLSRQVQDKAMQSKTTLRERSAPASGANGKAEPHTRSRQRARGPAFQGRRLLVLDWQLDAIRRMLGQHAEGFDVGAWLATLDERLAGLEAVVPRDAAHKWVLAETAREAQRRGLPVAQAPPNTSGRRVAAVVAKIRHAEGTR